MEAILGQIDVDPVVWLVLGGLLAVVGALKIIGQGLSMALWIVLLILGVSMTNYSLREGGVVLPPEYSQKLAGIIGPGRAMTKQTLKKLCADLMTEDVGTAAWCREQEEVPKSDWSPKETMAYAKSCLFADRL